MKQYLFAMMMMSAIAALAEQPAAVAIDPAVANKVSAPNGSLATVLAQQADFAAMKTEAVEGAMAAARATDERTRVTEWKRVDAVERKFNNMLNAGVNGVKLSKDDRQQAQQMFYTEFVNGVKEVEAQVQDPEVKAFFAKKRANYERKLNQGQKKVEPKKKAQAKKKNAGKKSVEKKQAKKSDNKKTAGKAKAASKKK